MAEPSPFPVHAAASSWSFRQSVGVNTHLDYTVSSYTDLGAVQRALGELGVTHVRDAFQAPAAVSLFQTLAAGGIRFDVVMAIDQPLQWQLEQAEANAALVDIIEGPNESDVWTRGYNGLFGLAATRAMQQDVFAFTRASTALAGKPVLQASLALGGSFAALGDLSAYADYGNVHEYFGTGNPPGPGVPPLLAQAGLVSPGLPVIASEGGYYTATTLADGVSEVAQAKYTLNLLFDNFEAGVARTYLYELADQRPDPAETDFHLHFGLYHSDWTPKPAARALANVTALLGGPGGTAPGALAYEITGLPGTGHDTLLQRADGSFVLALWNDVRIWDPVALADRPAEPAPIALDLGQSYARISLFDPMVSATTPIASFVNTRHVSLSLLDHPVLVVIDPALAPSQPLVSVVRRTAVEGASLGNVWADVIAAGEQVDPGRALRLTSVSLTGTRGYVQFDAATQTLSYLANGFDATAPVDSFSYVLTDSFGQTVAGLFSITVSGPAMPTMVSTVAGATLYSPAAGVRLVSQAAGQRLNGSGAGGNLFFAGPDTVVAAYGLGNTIVAAPGNHASIATGAGNATVRMGDGDQVIVAPGGGNTITLGRGNSNVSALGGNARVTIAGGDSQVYVTGAGNVVTTGSGADRITSTGGGARIDAGDGNNQVTANGSGNTVRTGAGDDLIQGSAGLSALDAGPGADTVRFGGSNSVVNGGDGDDLVYDSGTGNTVVLNRAGDGVDHVYGNLATNGLRFDLRATLSGTGWTGDTSTLDRFIGVETVAGNTIVTVWPDGRPSGGGSVVAVLHATGVLPLAAFLARSDLPDMTPAAFQVVEGRAVGGLSQALATLGRSIDPWSRGTWVLDRIDTAGLRGAAWFDRTAQTLDYQATGFDAAAPVDSMGYTLVDGLGHSIVGRVAFTIDGPARPTLVGTVANTTVKASAPGMRLIAGAPGQTLAGASAGQTAIFAGADARVLLYGADNTVDALPGSHRVSGGSGGARVVLATGEHTVTLGGTGNSVVAGAGNSTVSLGAGGGTVVLGDGNSIVTAGGAGNTISVGTGRMVIRGGSGQQRVTVAGGPATVTVSGADNTVATGAGADTVTSAGSRSAVSTGAGQDSIAVSGTGNEVRSGDDDDTVQGFGGGNWIDAGLGQDTIRFAGSGSIVDGGDGDDTLYESGTGNTLVLGSGLDHVYGDVLRNGDQFDLRAALRTTAWNGSVQDLGQFLRVRADGSGAVLSLDRSGSGPAADIAVLHGVGPLSLNSLVDHAILL